MMVRNSDALALQFNTVLTQNISPGNPIFAGNKTIQIKKTTHRAKQRQDKQKKKKQGYLEVNKKL